MQILGKNNEHVRVAFLALESEAAMNRSIDAVAARAFSGEVLRLYRAVQKFAKRSQKVRNKICHWTWGYSPNIQDGLLLLDPRAEAPEGDLRTDLVFVYKANDFKEAIQSNEQAARFFFKLGWICMGHNSNQDGVLEVELRAKLIEVGALQDS